MKRTAFLCLLLCGCATSNVIGFKDPAFAGHQFAHIAVGAIGMDLQSAFETERQMCQRLAPTRCEPIKEVLPPTRAYSVDEIQSALAGRGIDSLLILALSSDAAESHYIGSIGNVSAINSGAGVVNGNIVSYSGTTTGTTSSVPLYSAQRDAHGLLQIIEPQSLRVAWKGEVHVSGKGAPAISDQAFIRSATTQIAKTLRAESLLAD